MTNGGFVSPSETAVGRGSSLPLLHGVTFRTTFKNALINDKELITFTLRLITRPAIAFRRRCIQRPLLRPAVTPMRDGESGVVALFARPSPDKIWPLPAAPAATAPPTRRGQS